MPRQPFFGEDTPKVVAFIKDISEYHKSEKTQISLSYLADRVRRAFKKSPPKAKKVDEDRLRQIIFKLTRKHSIWYGKLK
jgi:hypothetical protein